jgi:hypothetical protein
MAEEAGEVGGTDPWRPVCRGFRVSLPDGERGCVEEVRLDDGAVELAVATGLFVRRLVTVRADEIEAILPRARRIVVRDSNGAAAAGDPGELEAAGGIVRMSARHSSRVGSSPNEAA